MYTALPLYTYRVFRTVLLCGCTSNFLLHYYLFKFLDNLASVHVAAYSSNVPWKAKTQ